MTVIASTKCQNCGNDLWEIINWDKKAYCTNCGMQRPYYTRKGRNFTAPSRSQEKAVQALREFYAESFNSGDDPLVETELHHYGDLFVSISTNMNPLLSDGGSFTIGRRGRIEIRTTEGFISSTLSTAKLYASMLYTYKRIKLHLGNSIMETHKHLNG